MRLVCVQAQAALAALVALGMRAVRWHLSTTRARSSPHNQANTRTLFASALSLPHPPLSLPFSARTARPLSLYGVFALVLSLSPRWLSFLAVWQERYIDADPTEVNFNILALGPVID